MREKLIDARNAALDAVSKTLENQFNVIQTAIELNEKYGGLNEENTNRKG